MCSEITVHDNRGKEINIEFKHLFQFQIEAWKYINNSLWSLEARQSWVRLPIVKWVDKQCFPLPPGVHNCFCQRGLTCLHDTSYRIKNLFSFGVTLVKMVDFNKYSPSLHNGQDAFSNSLWNNFRGMEGVQPSRCFWTAAPCIPHHRCLGWLGLLGVAVQQELDGCANLCQHRFKKNTSNLA